MELLRVVSLFVSLLRGAGCVLVFVGDPFTFPLNCKTDEPGQLIHIGRTHFPRTVAVHKEGEWEAAAGYRDRLAPGASIRFNRTVYTDTGVFELRCGGKVEEPRTQLDVVAPVQYSVSEGQTVSLQCYYSPAGAQRGSVKWKHGELVFQQDSSPGKDTDGDRLSVSADWFSHGDLSLTVRRVQLQDQGDYLCSVSTGGQWVHAGAVRLKVRGRNQEHITSTVSVSTDSVHSDSAPGTCGVSVGATAALCLAAGVLLALIGGRLKSYCSKSKSASRGTCAEYSEVNGTRGHMDTESSV